ncbi:MAG: N-acetylmuramoyl-L-alanine amidase [Lachnospiraceae bacterium]|nr:N-acetylmuramoyl-L-alanine amidase [Lachnospiraceae bacterium]
MIGMLGVTAILAFGSVFPAWADTVYVDASSLNFRNRPSMDADAVLGRYERGTKLERIANQGEWSEVRAEDSKITVYVASRYLTTTAPEANAGTGRAGQKPEESPYVDKTWEVGLDAAYPYASFSKISSGKAIYYHNGSEKRNGKVVCVNAGHGTKGGSSVKTQCHPDGSAKVTGGTTGAGATQAAAVSSGMTFADGTPEHEVTLAMAKLLKDKLLAAGYDVLMIREGSDIQLDNVARTVIANNNADCHIALHWDSTEKDKGCFFMSVPSNQTYRAMEPVASHWQSHNELGACLIEGLKAAGNKIFSSGSMEMDLTQTSYSTIPSVDIELGDKKSDHSQETLEKLGEGLLDGINRYFGVSK